MNYDLVAYNLIEDQERKRGGRNTADARIRRSPADVRMLQKQLGDGLDAGVDATRALRRSLLHVVENGFEISECG